MNKRVLIPAIMLFVLLMACLPVMAAPFGNLDVIAPGGIQIYVDGKLRGVTSKEENGLEVKNILEGEHTLKAEKDGKVLLERSFDVEIGLTTTIKIEE